LGAGLEFVAHQSLYQRPDPRRLDLRASLRSLTGDWLVRVHRQRASIAVHAIVDASSSMAFGARTPKLHVAADFVEALGNSAFRAGDAVGMLAFDAKERTDLFVPARVGRGLGAEMSTTLRQCESAPGGIEGLADTAWHVAGREGLIFLVSDFHWPLDRLGSVLDLFAPAHIVPLIVWDSAEIEPPSKDAIAPLYDAESGASRTFWLRPSLRVKWREAVEQRRAELNRFFELRHLRPFYIHGFFDSERLSRYFLEAGG
jgi:uncharacterized protein (DUF58 family)